MSARAISIVFAAFCSACATAPPTPASPTQVVAGAPAPSSAPPAASASSVAAAPRSPVLVTVVRAARGEAEEAVVGTVRILSNALPDEMVAGVARFPPSTPLAASTTFAVVFETEPSRVYMVAPSSIATTPLFVDASFRFRRTTPKNLSALVPGAEGRAKLVLGSHPAVLIPAGAIRGAGAPHVLRVVDEAGAKRARRVDVIPRPIAGGRGPQALVEIGSGVSIGDELVFDAASDVEDGTPIEIVTPRRTGIPQDECNPARFVVEGDVARDTRLRLDWQRDFAPELDFATATSTCAARGMRLPSFDELLSLREGDLLAHECALGRGGDYFWSATPGEYLATHWAVSPSGSAPTASNDGAKWSVRCVRDPR